MDADKNMLRFDGAVSDWCREKTKRLKKKRLVCE
jgi:hypothetical protein